MAALLAVVVPSFVTRVGLPTRFPSSTPAVKLIVPSCLEMQFARISYCSSSCSIVYSRSHGIEEGASLSPQLVSLLTTGHQPVIGYGFLR